MKNKCIAFGLIVAVSVAFFGYGPFAEAELKPTTELDRRVARQVCNMLHQLHISQHEVDDKMSARLHGEFLKFFDPMKMFFLASDIAEFDKSRTLHDDNLAMGDLSFAFNVYNRFVERLAVRTQWALEFAKAEHDFSTDDEVILDRDAAQYAKSDEEAKERWRRRIKYEILTLIVNGETENDARERIQKRYRNLKIRWDQVDTAELEEMFLSSLANAYDPHSTYMGAPTLKNFRIAIELSLEGIGAVLQAEDGMTIVKEIVTGGAADRDGRLKPGDKIVGAAQGEDGEMEDLENMKLSDVVNRIRGKAGTKVRLEVIPATGGKRVEYTLTRQKIQLTDRAAKGTVIETPKDDAGRSYRVGVIDLPSFYADPQPENGAEPRSASNDVRRILNDFKKQKVDAVIMDLRQNGGGLLGEAISLTGLFIDEGPVVQVRDYARRVTPYMDDIPGVAYDGPLVVLVSKFSASASEIFAGAIQDYRRGIVVGDSSTHGKGTVQKVLELGKNWIFANQELGAVKLTMQMFYRVNGQSTQTRGVLSDIVLPSVTDLDEFGEAKLDYALKFDTIDPADYRPFNGPVNENLIATLASLSQKRQQTDPELLELARKKQLVLDRRERKQMVFNEQILRKEREELEDKDAEKNDEKGKEPEEKKRNDEARKALLDEDGLAEVEKDEEPFGSNAYTKEVLRITADLLRLSNSSFTAR